MDSSSKQDLLSRMQHERQANRRKIILFLRNTQTCPDVWQLAMACHTPLRMCCSQSSNSIHQARQKERKRAPEREGRVEK